MHISSEIVPPTTPSGEKSFKWERRPSLIVLFANKIVAKMSHLDISENSRYKYGTILRPIMPYHALLSISEENLRFDNILKRKQLSEFAFGYFRVEHPLGKPTLYQLSYARPYFIALTILI